MKYSYWMRYAFGSLILLILSVAGCREERNTGEMLPSNTRIQPEPPTSETRGTTPNTTTSSSTTGVMTGTPGNASNKGIGPVKTVNLGPIDPQSAAKGQALFQTTCIACHRIDAQFIGPAMQGVTQRRTPEWIMNMILNPQEMLEKDPIAKELLAIYKVPMTPAQLSEGDARDILEYLRQIDQRSETRQ